MSTNTPLKLPAAIAYAEVVYREANRDLSGLNALPSTWRKDGRYWISPYFGSRMTMETAIRMEENITRLGIQRPSNPV